MLSSQDVVRHPLVQKIVKAYDDYEAKQKHMPGAKKKDLRKMGPAKQERNVQHHAERQVNREINRERVYDS